MRFRKKPVVIEAIQFTGPNFKEVSQWLLDRGWNQAGQAYNDQRISINTLEGHMTARRGDWIIRGVKGEFYPCKPDIFEATYDQVPDRELSEIEGRCFDADTNPAQAYELGRHDGLIAARRDA